MTEVEIRFGIHIKAQILILRKHVKGSRSKYDLTFLREKKKKPEESRFSVI